MRVVYAYRYGIVGGVSTQLLLRQAALDSASVRSILYFSQDNGLRQVLEDELVVFGADMSLRQLVARERPDAVVVIDSPELLDQASGRMWNNPRVYLDVHTTTQTGLAYLKEVSTRRLSGVFAPTEYSANLIRTRIPDADIRILPNILNEVVFRPVETEGPSCHADREFVWVGKLDSHKNWRLALVYACLLKKVVGRMRMSVVGGYSAPDELAIEFFDLVQRLDIENEIFWVDRIENTALAGIYQRCASTGGAMIVTSRDESFGMAAAEALLCGCPLISNKIPVFSEVIPKSPLVQLVDIWQPAEVAEAALRLCDYSDTRGSIGRVRSELLRRFSAESFIEVFLEQFD